MPTTTFAPTVLATVPVPPWADTFDVGAMTPGQSAGVEVSRWASRPPYVDVFLAQSVSARYDEASRFRTYRAAANE